MLDLEVVIDGHGKRMMGATASKMLSDRENNAFRERIGFDRNVEKKRKCLKCDKTFISEHKGNRICPSCNSNARGKLQVVG